jgi:predicted esterase
MPTAPERHTFTAQLDCRYLLHVPEPVAGGAVLILTLHGYGSNPESMLRLTTALTGAHDIIASLEGPNQHYAGAPGSGATAAYNWGIRDHWESAVELHHEMIRKTLGALRERFGIPPRRCLLAGFSQPVGLNYRFVGAHPDEVGGVLALCGGVPRDWEEDKYRSTGAAVLHISREEDEFYPAATAAGFPDRLRKHARDVEFHLIPGPHRFPSQSGTIVRPWMERVFGVA